eukprot:4148331-Pleurochrysis_carterae.AAC.7
MAIVVITASQPSTYARISGAYHAVRHGRPSHSRTRTGACSRSAAPLVTRVRNVQCFIHPHGAHLSA